MTAAAAAPSAGARAVAPAAATAPASTRAPALTAAPESAPAHEARPDTALALAALRARGASPVRLRHIEALVRRAQQHQGEARQLMDGRVQQLLAAGAEPAQRPAAATQTQTQTQPAARHQTLADLLLHITRHSTAPAAGPGLGTPELKAVRDYRSTWSRLGVEHRLTQALAKVPDNAGPLNTQRLLHEALAAMRHASPQYLHRFVVQVEALLWLDQVNQGTAVARKGRGAKT